MHNLHIVCARAHILIVFLITFFTCLLLLHLIPASDPLAVEFVLDMRSDPEFSGIPKVIYFSGEVFSELS